MNVLIHVSSKTGKTIEQFETETYAPKHGRAIDRWSAEHPGASYIISFSDNGDQYEAYLVPLE